MCVLKCFSRFIVSFYVKDNVFLESFSFVNNCVKECDFLACSPNKSISCLSMSHRDVPSSMKRFHTVGFNLLWLSIFVSMFAMRMLAKAIYQVPIRARFNVPNMPKAA